MSVALTRKSERCCGPYFCFRQTRTEIVLCPRLKLNFCVFYIFQDPSVTQVTRNAPPGLEEYNPFTDTKPVSRSYVSICFI